MFHCVSAEALPRRQHEGHLLVGTIVQCPLGACGTPGIVEEELRTHIQHQAVPLQVEIGLDVECFHWVRIFGVGSL
jgi:hypothetical protein